MTTTVDNKIPPMQPGKSHTYMLFTKRGKGFGRLMGPILGAELPAVKERFFSDVKTIHILEETVFANRFSKRYWQHIAASGWMDKLYTYFLLNKRWIGSVNADIEGRGFSSTWFTMFETFEDNEKKLQIQFVTHADKFYPPRLTFEVQKMLPFKVLIKEEYYASTEKVYTGALAVRRQLAEQFMKTVCLS